MSRARQCETCIALSQCALEIARERDYLKKLINQLRDEVMTAPKSVFTKRLLTLLKVKK